MAVTTFTAFSTNNRAVYVFTNNGDVEADVVKVDISSLTGPDGNTPDKLSIYRVNYSCNDSVEIKSGSTTLLRLQGYGVVDFFDVGGIKGGSAEDITFSCAANTDYNIKLEVKKHK